MPTFDLRRLAEDRAKWNIADRRAFLLLTADHIRSDDLERYHTT